MNIAIIPARGGSKRIPKKNIKSFAGKPIIYFPIKVALASGLFDSVVVSTDDPEIADIATANGAAVPFIRSKQLSNDYIPTAPVVVDTLMHLKKEDIEPDYFCCIYPTAAFIETKYLDKGYQVVKQAEVHTVIAVTSYPSPILRALRLNSEGFIEMFWKEHLNTRSQDLPMAYMDAGQFYWGKTRQFLLEKELYTEKSKPIVLPRYIVHDIDTIEDWNTAEQIFRALSLDKPFFE